MYMYLQIKNKQTEKTYFPDHLSEYFILTDRIICGRLSLFSAEKLLVILSSIVFLHYFLY